MKRKYLGVALALIISAQMLLAGCNGTSTEATLTNSPQAEGDIVRTETFTTTDTTFQYDFPSTIDEGGKYNLKSVEYRILSTEYLKRDEPLVQSITFTDLYTKNAAAGDTIEIEKDGQSVQGTLDSIIYTPKTVTNRKATVTAYTDFDYKTITPSPAATKTVPYYDPILQREVMVELQLQELQEADTWDWRPDVEIPAKFQIYNAEYYVLGDQLIPHDDDKPALQGHENLILDQLGLDREKYRLTTIEWTSEPYYVGEVLYRDAMIAGESYTANYIAKYESVVELPDAPGFDAVATYKTATDTLSGITSYTVEAKAIYSPDNTTLLIIGIAVGVLLFAVVIVLTIYIIAKRNRKPREKKQEA